MDTFIIDDELEKMAIEGCQHFAPHYICQRLGINEISAVADYLLSLTNSKLIPYFEVECPNGDSDFIVENPNYIPSEPRECSICGIEYEPDPENIWLAFDFTPQYLDHIKKNYSRPAITTMCACRLSSSKSY